MGNRIKSTRESSVMIRKSLWVFIMVSIAVVIVAARIEPLKDRNSIELRTDSCANLDYFQAPSVAIGPALTMVSADFDNDGYPDIALASSNATKVWILRNITSTNNIEFGASIDFSIAGIAQEINAADFDGDGKIDIVAFNHTGSMSILLNRSNLIGDISFASRADFPIGNVPKSSSVADFDNDGKSDIALIYLDSNNTSVFRNLTSSPGNVVFGPASNVTQLILTRSMASGDLDGDSKVDLVVTNSSSTLRVLRNTTSGTSISFAPFIDFDLTSSGGYATRISDFDGDGRRDILVASNVGILAARNISSVPGSINFAPTISFLSAVDAVAIADFDGDNRPDSAGVSRLNIVTVLKNQSNPGSILFGSPGVTGVGQGPQRLLTGDFDTDGDIDIVTLNQVAGSLTILRNQTVAPGPIAFEARLELALGINAINPFSVALANLDGDTLPDIITANSSSGNISILRNLNTSAGVARFAESMQVASPPNSGPYAITAGDLDSDGRADVVVSNSTSNTISIFQNNSNSAGSIVLLTPSQKQVGASPQDVVLADLDSDQKVDVVTANRNAGNISILRNSTVGPGAITLENAFQLAVNSDPTSMAAADLNGDGKLDLAVSNASGTTISIFANQTTSIGAINFGPKVDLQVNQNPFSIATADFNGDSRIDLAVSHRIADRFVISVFPNLTQNGGGILFGTGVQQIVSINNLQNPISGTIAVEDIQFDGKPDIVTTDLNNGYRVAVLRNNSTLNGGISFLNPVTTDVSGVPIGLALRDINSDQSIDIVYASYNSNIVGILPNPCQVSYYSVSGRVMSPAGQALRNVPVSLIDSAGVRRVSVTSSFGVFVFDNVRGFETFTLAASSKRYRFAPRILQVTATVNDANLIGLE
ncbi:MAG: VCBS repeat-containing protein [Pyrinomonadaceae bacterium]